MKITNSFPINPRNLVENHYSNGISYTFEYLEDGWIAIYEYIYRLPLRPLIKAKNKEKALEFIAMREPVPVPLSRLC